MGGGEVRDPLFFPSLILVIHPEVFSENGLTQVNLVLLSSSFRFLVYEHVMICISGLFNNLYILTLRPRHISSII